MLTSEQSGNQHSSRVPQDQESSSTVPAFIRLQAILKMQNQITTFIKMLWGPS